MGIGDVKWELSREKALSATDDIRLWALLRPVVDPINDARLEDGGPLKEGMPALDKSRAEGTRLARRFSDCRRMRPRLRSIVSGMLCR